MGRSEEPKMDELKKLLRRLDGLEGKGPNKAAPDVETTQRGYVGALRGTPVAGDEDLAVEVPVPAPQRSSGGAIFLAAIAAAVISTVTVYFLVARPPMEREAGPVPSASQGPLPSKLELKSPPPPAAPGQRQSADTDETLIRRAELLLESGQVEAARNLLQQAAERGSGLAALKLGRTYDPAQSGGLRYADSQTNPALAQAWYERALALGTPEAASYIADKGTR